MAGVDYPIIVGDQEYQSNIRFHEYLTRIGVKHKFAVLPGFGRYGTGTPFLSAFLAKNGR